MKRFVTAGFILLILILLAGCTTTKEITEIKPKVIYPPVIEDSIKAASITDSVITGIFVETGHTLPTGQAGSSLQNDTTIIVKYFPKLEKFYMKAKPDSIVYWDTVHSVQTVEKDIETPLLSKIGLVFIGILITVILGFFFYKK